MPRIRWANDAHLQSSLGREEDQGGRLDNAYGTEASLQIDDNLFSGNSLLGRNDSHFK